MNKFDPSKFEKKWSQKWVSEKLYKTPEIQNGQEKFYSLYSFPYPSGAGLHVGHAEGMVANDIAARYYRMKGRAVTLPMGWDSFGLPAENYAIKTGVTPQESTEAAVKTFIEQIKNLGISVDWDKEVGAHRADYYKWTQWIFLELYKKGLAYKKEAPVNWCPKDQTVLANEQVINGKCERCDTEVVQKNMAQWFFKITEFAERLDKELDSVDWPESTKLQQRNWIGKSEGTIVQFKINGDPGLNPGSSSETSHEVEVFTTRVDTIFGATFLVLAPENPIIESLKAQIKNFPEVETYVNETKKKSELDRQINKEKTGVKLEGISATNPFNGAEIPVFISDYVLMGYGTGAIMAVPGHDERDMEFAFKHNIPIEQAITQKGIEYISYITRGWSNNFDKFVNDISSIAIFVKRSTDEVLFKFKEEHLQIFIEAAKENVRGQKAWHDAVSENEAVIIFGEKHPDYNHPTEEMQVETVAKFAESPWAFKQMQALNIEMSHYTSLWHMFSKSDYAEKVHNNEYGVLTHTSDYEGMTSEEAINKMQSWLSENNLGGKKVNYKIRDWLVSRQRYWGAPIPIVYSEEKKEQGYGYLPKEPLNILMLHGLGSEGLRGWRKYVKDEMESIGHKVFAPNLPTSDQPVFNEWMKFIETEYKEILSKPENLVIIGHSLGGLTALKLAERYRAAKLITIASAAGLTKEDQATINEFSTLDNDLAKFLVDAKETDEKKIIENISEIIMINSPTDEVIKPKYQKILKDKFENNAEFIEFENYKHFSTSDMPVVNGKTIFPELLHLINIKGNTLNPGVFPAYETDLPLVLPTDVDFKPTGESPITTSDSFKKRAEDLYGKGFRYEFDTMDTFVDSSWYFFRFTDAKNENVWAESKNMNEWLPVDLYMIGAEHIVLHLLYSRFFTKFFFDKGLINFNEPFQKMRHMGTILGPDGRKMSKRWGNVINPDDEIKKFSADTVRMYEMFMGPLDEEKPWNDRAENGVFRFLGRVWNLHEKVSEDKKSDAQEIEINKLIKKVSSDIETLSFNTSVAKFMEFINFAEKEDQINKEVWMKFLLVLAPFAPFITEELWEIAGGEYSIHTKLWPEVDESKLSNEKIKIGIQINGKIRDVVETQMNATQEVVMDLAKSSEKVSKYLVSEPKKIIFVPNKILNIIL